MGLLVSGDEETGVPARVVLGENLGERAADRREFGGGAVDHSSALPANASMIGNALHLHASTAIGSSASSRTADDVTAAARWCSTSMAASCAPPPDSAATTPSTIGWCGPPADVAR